MQLDPVGYGDNMNMYAYVGNDPINFTDPSGMIGRGNGWTDPEWDKFNKIQKKAAEKARKKASKKRKQAEKLRNGKKVSAKDIAKADKLDSEASVIEDIVKILDDDGTGGHTIDSLTVLEWAAKGLNKNALAAGVVNGKKTFINKGHSFYIKDTLEMKWAISHEPLHNLGYRDQKFQGVRAYKFGTNAQKRAYRKLPNELRMKNPDHIVDLVY